MKKIKVLIVDDSQTIRSVLREVLKQDDEIEVIGEAEDPYDAREKIKSLRPDVVTLDIEMPRMNGLTFLSNLMRLYPLPVVMVSTLTQVGAEETLKALELGAVDFVPKPSNIKGDALLNLAKDIIAKIKCASKVDVSLLSKKQQKTSARQTSVPSLRKKSQQSKSIELIAIGASTGGTEAIRRVLEGLPGNLPPIVIVQHMPPGFTLSFATRLDNLLPNLKVKETTQSPEELKRGTVYIANGAFHLNVKRKAGSLYAVMKDTAPVNRHKPAVDELFASVAAECGASAIGIVLTGMGRDGAMGIEAMKQQGAMTIAQDQATSIVWGMPKAAAESGCIDYVLPLGEIYETVCGWCA